MLRTTIITLVALTLAPEAWSACTIARGAPTTLTIPGQTIYVSADAPADTSTPIAQFDSGATGQAIGYDFCLPGTEFGKRTMNLGPQDSATRIYQTNLPGIGIKLQWNNSEAFGQFPSTAYLVFPNNEEIGTADINAGAFYRIEFFKTKNNLQLNNPQGETILPPGEIAYNYILTAHPSSYMMKLAIGEIKIISTPACTTDGAKTVDFNKVTPSLLSSGVTRNLDFTIECKSDYGAYSAKASIVTASPSADASYIRVEDAAGNKDRLGIKITDSADRPMKVNGSSTEQRSGIASQGPAEFTWRATLIPGTKPSPAGGVFNAKAEIVFDIQ